MLARLLDYFQAFAKHFIEIFYSKIISISEVEKKALNHMLTSLVFYIY